MHWWVAQGATLTTSNFQGTILAGADISVAVADLDGDGKADLAVANTQKNEISVLRGDGTGAFGAAATVDVDDDELRKPRCVRALCDVHEVVGEDRDGLEVARILSVSVEHVEHRIASM